MEVLGRSFTKLGELTAHPGAFAILAAYCALWYYFEPETLDWHALATIGTWFMTLLIQRSGYRDTQAIQAKLDELIRVDKDARTELSRLDEKEPEDIKRHRERSTMNPPGSATGV